MFRIFAVFKNADMTEGRGPMVFHTAFSDETVANTYAESRSGVMGTLNNGWEVRPLTVHDSISAHLASLNPKEHQIEIEDISRVNLKLVQEELRDSARKVALAKLTDEEKRLLGLN